MFPLAHVEFSNVLQLLLVLVTPVVLIGEFPMLEFTGKIKQSHLSVHAVLQIHPVTPRFRRCQDKVRMVYVTRVQVELSPSLYTVLFLELVRVNLHVGEQRRMNQILETQKYAPEIRTQLSVVIACIKAERQLL